MLIPERKLCRRRKTNNPSFPLSLKRGAVAGKHCCLGRIINPLLKSADCKSALAIVSFYAYPEEPGTAFGITGRSPNGKGKT
jgi:hypothetical protein